MKSFFILFVFIVSFRCYADYNFPTGIDISQAYQLVDRFGVGFIGKSPAPIVRDRYNTQLNLSWNWLDTSKVSRLGDGNSKDVIQYQEVHFAQELPYDIEVGLRGSLLMLNNDITSYGGYGRWAFFEIPFGRLSLRVHGSSANYRNQMGINLYGSLLEMDLFYRNIILTAGMGPLRTTALFQAQVFSQGGVQISGDERAVRVARRYTHQVIRATYLSGQWNLSVQVDRVKDFYNSMLLGYVF